MSKPIIIKLDASMQKEELGKVDVSFRYNAEDESSCYISFKPKVKKKGKRASKLKEEIIVNDESLTYLGDGVYAILFQEIGSVRVLPPPGHRFKVGTKNQRDHHIFITSKKIKKRWVETITKYLNYFKQNQQIGIRSTFRSQAGVFSNTMQFRGKGTLAESPQHGSSRGLGSQRDKESLDVFKSPKIQKSLRDRQSKTTGRGGQTQFQALSKGHRTPAQSRTNPGSKSDRIARKLNNGKADITILQPSYTKSKNVSLNKGRELDQFYTHDPQKNDFFESINNMKLLKNSKQPAPPSMPPPSTKIFQTYVKAKTTIIKADEIETLNRKVVVPVFFDETDNRDYSKTEKELKFLRNTVRTSKSIQTVVAKSFDDKALEDMVEKMFKKNCIEDERIVEAGDRVHFLYILEKGLFVQSIPDTNNSVRRTAKGSTYGEIQLKYGTSSTFTVVCAKDCKFWCLARQDYLEIARWSGQRNQQLRLGALKSVDTFKKVFSANEFTALADSLDMHFATEGDVVLQYNNEVTELILVAQGEIHLFGLNDKYPRAKLEKDDHFGMLGLFESVLSKFRLVVADRKTVYFTLRIKDFEEMFGGIKPKIEAAMKQTQQRNQTAMVARKPLTINHHLNEIRQTMSTLASLPPMSQAHTMAPPSIRTIGMTEAVFDDESDEENYEEEQVDFPFLDSPALLPRLKYSDLDVLSLINHGNFGHVYTVRYANFTNPQSPDLKIKASPEETGYAFPEYAPVGFALKIMPRYKITKNGWQDKVDNEMLAMAEVSYYCRSPFILQLYHSFCCPKFIHMVIELGEGGDLYNLVREQKGRHLDERAARYYIASVVNGLDVLHQRKILYRDLKPENLILNNKGHLKVADLGLAKKTTRTATQCGTPEYTAPEVIANMGHDHACDWWAVGVLVYELHYGETPFFASRSTIIYDKIENHTSPIRFYDEHNQQKRRRNKQYGYLKGRHKLSSECKDLIAKFLVPKSSLRLGYVKPGAQKVREHQYFTSHGSFSWERLAQLKEIPPFVIDLPEADRIENLEQDPGVRYVNERRRDQSSWEPKVNTVLEQTPIMQKF